jgi:hypothetical protein
MSYADIVAGLHERFATVAGIVGIGIGEPDSVADTPYLYTLLDEVVHEPPQGTVAVARYRSLHRLLFATQDTEQAESALLPLVDAVVDAVDADATLDGVLTLGYARITDARGVWVTINGTLYRAVDFISEAIDKRPFRRP